MAHAKAPAKGASAHDADKPSHTLENIPSLNRHPDDMIWDSEGPRLVIQVDNQTVANLANGDAILTEEAYRPIFVRILRNLAALTARGWRTRRDHEPLVQWRDRVSSIMSRATWLTMCLSPRRAGSGLWDGGCITAAPHTHPRYLLSSDGGFTGASGAAAFAMLELNDDSSKGLC